MEINKWYEKQSIQTLSAHRAYNMLKNNSYVEHGYERDMLLHALFKSQDLTFDFLTNKLYYRDEKMKAIKIIANRPEYCYSILLNDENLTEDEVNILFMPVLYNNYYVTHFIIKVGFGVISINPTQIELLIKKVTSDYDINLAKSILRNIDLNQNDKDLIMSYILMDKLVNV